MNDLPLAPDVVLGWIEDQPVVDDTPPPRRRRNLFSRGPEPAVASAFLDQDPDVIMTPDPTRPVEEGPDPNIPLTPPPVDPPAPQHRTNPFMPGPAAGPVNLDDPAERIAEQMQDPVVTPGEPTTFPVMAGFPHAPGALWFQPTDAHVALMVAAQYGDSIEGVMELADVFEQWLHDLRQQRQAEAE